MTLYYECQLCGHCVPFDPAFDVAQIESGSYIVERDAELIPSTATVDQIATHIEEEHNPILDYQDDPDYVAFLFTKIFQVKEASAA